MNTRTALLVLAALTFSACGHPPAADETTALVDECVMMLEVTDVCLYPTHEVTDSDRQKCHDGAAAAVATPGCVEVAHEEIACLQAFFASYNQCVPAMPTNTQVYQDLQNFAMTHCPSLLTPATAALHCPDFT